MVSGCVFAEDLELSVNARMVPRLLMLPLLASLLLLPARIAWSAPPAEDQRTEVIKRDPPESAVQPPEDSPPADNPGAPQEQDPQARPEEPDGDSDDGGENPLKNQARAQSHWELASQYFGQWKLDLAEVELDESIMYDPKLKVAHRDLCVLELLRGNPMRSLAEFMVVVGLADAVPLNVQEKAELNAKALNLHYHYGLKSANQGKWEDALTEFFRALPYGRQDARLHRSIAFAYANLGNFEAAEKEYAQCFAMDPGDAFGHADFANVLSEKGQAQLAAQQMSEAVKLAPGAAALHVDLAWMAESSGDFAKAGQEFATAVKLSPGHAGLWTHLGHILERLGKSDEAVEAYSKALAIDPAHDEARQRIARLKPETHS